MRIFQLRAKHESTCCQCRGTIRIGDDISYDADAGYASHKDCDPGEVDDSELTEFAEAFGDTW